MDARYEDMWFGKKDASYLLNDMSVDSSWNETS